MRIVHFDSLLFDEPFLCGFFRQIHSVCDHTADLDSCLSVGKPGLASRVVRIIDSHDICLGQQHVWIVLQGGEVGTRLQDLGDGSEKDFALNEMPTSSSSPAICSGSSAVAGALSSTAISELRRRVSQQSHCVRAGRACRDLLVLSREFHCLGA